MDLRSVELRPKSKKKTIVIIFVCLEFEFLIHFTRNLDVGKTVKFCFFCWS